MSAGTSNKKSHVTPVASKQTCPSPRDVLRRPVYAVFGSLRSGTSLCFEVTSHAPSSSLCALERRGGGSRAAVRLAALAVRALRTTGVYGFNLCVCTPACWRPPSRGNRRQISLSLLQSTSRTRWLPRGEYSLGRILLLLS